MRCLTLNPLAGAYNIVLNRGSNSPEVLVGIIAKRVFSDGITNWGRIASLLALCAMVSLSLVRAGRVSSVELVGRELSTCLLTDQRDWLIRNNSWVS